ncbi:glycosyltransferase family 2 protein [Massilia sp. TSP1-1-2]|uniref:glycosyltransferase family 2 protein n=1 Tax=Massilia sp. TSP1-1-2 TaxID=2804649 RepID=UPI003CE7B9C4
MTATLAASGTPAVLVSVVVPTRNRVHLLGRCIDALLDQTLLPCEYEIIIVDDAPDYHTRQLAAMWSACAATRGLHLRYVPKHGARGPAAARNVGWRLARPIVAFTDDDAIAMPSWLAQGLAVIDDCTDAVCGQIDIPLPTHPTDYERNTSLHEQSEFIVASCFLRKSVLFALGGFDERFRRPWREDSDLYFRLLDMSATIVRAPRSIVIHPVRPAPWGVSLLQMRKIAFDALLYKKHPQRYREKIRATPRWDYYAIVALLALALGAPAAHASVLAAAAGAAWLAMTGRLCARRLRGTSRRVSHVAEMVLTSALIPPLAVFWRMAGAVRFRVRFA